MHSVHWWGQHQLFSHFWGQLQGHVSESLIPLAPPAVRIVLKERQNVDWESGGEVWFLWSCSDGQEPAFVHLLTTHISVPLTLWKAAISSGLLNRVEGCISFAAGCAHLTSPLVSRGWWVVAAREGLSRPSVKVEWLNIFFSYAIGLQSVPKKYTTQRDLILQFTGELPGLGGVANLLFQFWAFETKPIWCIPFPLLQTSLGLGWNIPLQRTWRRFELKPLSKGWKCRD